LTPEFNQGYLFIRLTDQKNTHTHTSFHHYGCDVDMPTPLSCKSASALDSLPRHTNVKRSSSALNRLQQRKQSQNNHHKGAEFGILPSSQTVEHNIPRVPIRKTASKNGKTRKTSQGLASNDLPLASSDLYSDEETFNSPALFQTRYAFSDGEQGAFSEADEDDDDKGIRLIGGMRARSVSPTKASRPMRIQEEVDSIPSSPILASPSRRPTPSMPARKRVITKAMIGTPTNFQHTGHIGASSYNALQRGGDAEQLQKQLSEVAAALKLDDDFVSAAPVSKQVLAREVDKGSDASTLAPSLSPSEAVVMEEPIKKQASFGSESPVSVRVETQTQSQNGSPTKTEVGLKRTTSKRKPVPAPRNLAALYDEFNDQVKEEDEGEPLQANNGAAKVVPLKASLPMSSSNHTENREEEQAEEESIAKPLPTIRAQNGKRLVPGPAGDYITDTANGRWNNALDEITKALKSDGNDDDDNDEEDLQDGLRRADQILARLNAV
jgi:hypothetical protein